MTMVRRLGVAALAATGPGDEAAIEHGRDLGVARDD